MALDASVGTTTANSYVTVAEGDAFIAERVGTTTAWTGATTPQKEAALITATRYMDMVHTPRRLRVDDDPPYYMVRPEWTGEPTNDDQRLAWPRTGMFNRNGFAIDQDEIPRELKEATIELAFQLLISDRALDNDVAVQGITSIKAGPVSLSFKDVIEINKILPEAVLDLLVPSWLTEEILEWSSTAQFRVI